MYFYYLGQAQQRYNFAAQQVAIAGGITGPLLALFQAGVTAMAATTAAFGFTTATLQNLQQVYLFGPDVSNVYGLVVKSQNIFLTDLATSGGVSSFDGAVEKLAQFGGRCQPHEIRALINTAVNQAQLTTEQTATALQHAAIVMAVGAFTDDQLVYLYWITLGDRQPADEAKLRAGLSGISKLFANGQLRSQSELVTEPFFKDLTRAIASLPSATLVGLRNRVQELRGTPVDGVVPLRTLGTGALGAPPSAASTGIATPTPVIIVQ